MYSEDYPDAFYDLYHGRRGYLYACDQLPQAQQPTKIWCAYTVEEPVQVTQVQAIEDLYAWFIAQGEGFRIKPRVDISEKEMALVYAELGQSMAEYGLKAQPEHPMSLFIRKNFPEVWESE